MRMATKRSKRRSRRVSVPALARRVTWLRRWEYTLLAQICDSQKHEQSEQLGQLRQLIGSVQKQRSVGTHTHTHRKMGLIPRREMEKECKNIQEWRTECKREEDGYIGRVNEKSTRKLPQRKKD